MREKTFRIAYRAFAPFEAALRREWTALGAGGLSLELAALEHHALYEALFTRQGLKRGDWDVALVNTDWVAEAHETDALADLAPYIEVDPPGGYPEAWTPSLLRFQRFGEKVLGLPYHDGPECFIYRKDLFEDPDERRAYRERYGAELAVPDTWEAFARTARFFTRPERGLHGTVCAAYPDGHNTVYDICLHLWTRGGELFDAAGRVSLDTPQMAEALAYYRDLIGDARAIHPESRRYDSVKSGEAFARGEVAMMINWFGFASMGETVPGSKVKGLVAVDSIPHAPGKASASLNVYWLIAVAAGSPHRAQGYEFVRNCVSREQDKRRTLDGAIGCRRSTWSDPEVNSAIPFYSAMEALHAGARELPRLREWVALSAVVDRMVLRALDTNDPVDRILRGAQREAEKLSSSARPR